MEKPVCFKLETFLSDQQETFHIARTTISSKNDLVYHTHDYAEVFWIEKGEGIHLINQQELPIKSGTFYLIRPKDCHTFKVKGIGNNLVITNVAFARSNLDYYQPRYFPGQDKLFWSKEKIPFSFHLEQDQLHDLSVMADRLLTQPRDFLHLDYILLHIFRLLTRVSTELRHLPHWLAYALDHFNRPDQFQQGLPAFVALTGRSIDHVNRTLQHHLQQTLTETINKAKLEYARHQLIMTNAPIKSISANCGYDNLSYFHRIFKKQYGLSPKNYRRINHNFL